MNADDEKTLHEIANGADSYHECAIGAYALGRASMREEAEREVPMTWLDPLLTGDKSIGEPPYNCPDIECLLNGIRDRIRAIKE